MEKNKELREKLKRLTSDEANLTAPAPDRNTGGESPNIEKHRTESPTQPKPVAENDTNSGPRTTTQPEAAAPVTDAAPRADGQNQQAFDPATKCDEFLLAKFGSNEKIPEADRHICLMAASISSHGGTRTYLPSSERGVLAKAMAEWIAALDNKRPVLNSQAARTDKQIGADAGSAGTTSVVAKGGVPLIMSLATEIGAATSSINGTTLSYRFNPIGLYEYIRKQTTDNFSLNESATNFLRHSAFGVSFDTSRGVPTPTFTGTRDQFSGASFRYEFTNHRNPTDETARRYYKSFMIREGLALDYQVVTDLNKIFNVPYDPANPTPPPTIKAFEDGLKAAITAKQADVNAKDVPSGTELLYSIIKDYFQQKNTFASIKDDPEVSGNLKKYDEAVKRYNDELVTLQRRLKRSTLFTFDYNYNRGFTASDTSNFRLVYEKGFGNGVDLVFNGEAAIFHDPHAKVPVATITPFDQKRFRDFSFAGELDIPFFGKKNLVSESAVLSLAGRYQRMKTGSITLIDGTVVNNLSGDIWVGQGRFLIPIAKTGLFFPISFTYANRTELIREKKSRGNFGFTFDLSSLLEKFLAPNL